MGLYTKKIKEFLGLEEKSNNCFYGVYKGYELTLHVSQAFEVFMNFYASDEVKLEAAKIFQTAETTKMVNTEVSLFGIHAIVNGATFKTAMKKLIAKLDKVVEYLTANEVLGVGYCMSCGNQASDLKTIKMQDVYITLDNECLEKLEIVVKDAEEAFDAAPNNYAKGFLGALLGAGIGAVAWVILYSIGFVSALIAVLAVFLGNYFYVKFGGKPNKAKAVIVAVVSLVVLVLTCMGVYIVVVQGLMAESNLSGSALDFILSTPELKEAFTYDMIMNALFTIIGVALQYSAEAKKDKAKRVSISK